MAQEVKDAELGGNANDWHEALQPSEDDLPASAQKILASLEIVPQEGVEYESGKMRIPGRVALMPVTLLQTLTATLGFSLAVVFFSRQASQFLMPLAVVQIVLFSQIALYHTSFRALRMGLALFHVIFTIAFTAFVDWALLDRVLNFEVHASPYLLYAAVVLFSAQPLIMLLHWLYLGRSYRYV
ncbi:MAG: hypothetical protein WC966_02950 [Bradymonadales bacterium]